VIYTLCLAVCLFLAWFSLGAAIDAFATHDFDMRGFDMPLGWVYGPMTLGIVLTALEFLRYLIGRDSIYAVDATARDTI
jgi:TRAP-type C4-dicarboxylate transport system permease small subunit